MPRSCAGEGDMDCLDDREKNSVATLSSELSGCPLPEGLYIDAN